MQGSHAASFSRQLRDRHPGGEPQRGFPEVQPPMSAFFDIVFMPFTAFFALVGRKPVAAAGIAVVLSLLAFVTHHGAWGATFVMFGSFVLIWISETTGRLRNEQGSAAGH